MVLKPKLAIAATFGAAMTSIYSAPDLHGAIVNLTLTPGSVNFGSDFVPVNINGTVGPTFLGTVRVRNLDDIGKVIFPQGISSIGLVSASQTLTNGQTWVGNVVASESAAGTAYIGFKAGGNVGWFSLNWGGLGGAIVFGSGEYGTAGESVHVGASAIPEPSSAAGLALLALGACGLRRRRKHAS